MSDHISPAEQEKLDQFQIITSFKEEDYDKVVTLLRNNYWNLEIAVSKYFDGDLDAMDSSDAFNDARPSDSATPFEQTPFIDERPLENLQMQDFSAIGVIPSLIKVSPISNKWRRGPGLIEKRETRIGFGNFTESPIWFLLLLIPRAITILFLKINDLWSYFFPSSPNAMPLEPTLTRFNFPKYYEDITKDSIDFKMSDLDYNEVLKYCNQENKLLLLILIKEDDELTSTKFIKKILNNPSIKQLLVQESITEDNLVCYIGSVNEPQGFEIAKSLKIRVLPVVYLIGNVGSGSSINVSMSILAKIPIKTLNVFKSRLVRELTRFKPELVLRKLEKSELDYSREIKKLQDDAFEESLKKDQLKKRQQEEEKKKKEEEVKKRERLERNKGQFLIELYNKYNNRDLSPLGKGESTAIRIKLADGSSITEKVSYTESLLDLYSLIQLRIYLNSLSDDEAQKFIKSTANNESVDDDYEHDFEFELISPFPRFIIPIDSRRLIKDVSQLWPNGSLLVEFNNNEDDE